MNTRGLFFILAITAGAACGGDDGGGSGVDGSKTVVSLSASERTDVCTYVYDTAMGHTVTCSDVTFDGPSSVAECESGFSSLPATCAVTVAQVEACANAIAAGDCAGVEANCAAVFACLGS